MQQLEGDASRRREVENLRAGGRLNLIVDGATKGPFGIADQLYGTL